MEDFSGAGMFWLPNDEDHKVAGRLEFTPQDGATLELIGDLTRSRSPVLQLPNASTFDRIVGIANKKAVTLDQCLVGNTVMNSPGTTLMTLHPQFVLAGAHFDAGEALRFYAIAVSFTRLHAWTHHVGTSLSWPQTGRVRKFSLNYEEPTEEEFAGAFGTMTLGSTWNIAGDHVERSEFTYDSYIKIEREEDGDLFEDLLPLSQGLQDLLTLATDSVTYPRRITLWHRDLDQTTVELWYQRSGKAEPPSKRLVGPDMTFTYEQFGELPGVYRWLSYAEQYHSVVASMLANRYRPSTYVENRLLNAVVAAESFDRTRFDNTIMPRAEFRTMRDNIVSQVSKERQQWLREQLAHSNEPRLRYRLKRMALHAGPKYLDLVGDVDVWAGAVTRARNDIAHGRRVRVPENTASKGAYIHWLAESVMTLVLLSILKECASDRAFDHAVDNERIKFAGRELREIIGDSHGDSTVELGDDDLSHSDGRASSSRVRRLLAIGVVSYLAARLFERRSREA